MVVEPAGRVNPRRNVQIAVRLSQVFDQGVEIVHHTGIRNQADV